MIKINKKKVLSLLTAGLISLSHLPHVSAEIKTEGDKITAKVKVNIRVNNNIDSELLGRLKENVTAKRIFSCDNGWSLVEYDGRLGFVKNEFIKDISNENIYCDTDFYETRKILLTNSDAKMHLDCFNESNIVSKIPCNTKLEVIAYTSNDWYLVNYHNKLGFIEGKYLTDVNVNEKIKMVTTLDEVNIRSKASTNSEKYNILYKGDYYPFIREEKNFYVIDYYGTEAYVVKSHAVIEEKDVVTADFIKLVYVRNDTFLFNRADINSGISGYIEEFETGEVLSDEGNFYLIRTNDQEGYIDKNNVTSLKGMVVDVDISDQKLYIYQDNSIIFQTNVVTGHPKTPTNIGKYFVQYEDTERILRGEDYETLVNYWKQYDNNYGFHDYEKLKGNFGGSIYKKNGSHGCIRMHIIPMEKFYKLVKVKTPVIIHK